jgi:uncharacterized protein DUF3617
MKRLIVAIFIFVVSPVLAQNVKMKPGLWEIRVERQVMDGRDMTAQMALVQEQMPQAMANMSPEQRKQLEAMMGGKGRPFERGASGTRVCISAAMAARDSPLVDPQGRCEPAKVERSGDTTKFEFNCTAGGRTMVGKGQSTVRGDTVATSTDMTVSAAGGRHTMQSESRMKYVGADCQGIRPLDEIARARPGPAP